MIAVRAPTNIALIKYWGKSDRDNIIPLNESISVSLDLYTTTTVTRSEEIEFILNGQPQVLKEHTRIVKCIERFHEICKLSNIEYYPVKIETKNDFPTASGLASSASGGAALVKALNQLYNIGLSDDELSILARLTSGSACRSISNGFVKWSLHAPPIQTLLPHSNCRAIPIPSTMKLFGLVVVLDSKQKKTPSTVGMQNTVETSRLFPSRLDAVHERIEEMEKHIRSNDFENLAILTMKDAMTFHACCLDTWPPIRYLTDLSFDIIDLVHDYNKNGVKCAYTFDAGANAVLLFNSADDRNNLKETISKQYDVIEC